MDKFNGFLESFSIFVGAKRQRSWLRNWTRSRNNAGSIPDGVLRLFAGLILPVTLWPCRSTRTLIKVSTRDFPWEVKKAGAYDWQSCQLHIRIVWKCLEPRPLEAFVASLGQYRDIFKLSYTKNICLVCRSLYRCGLKLRRNYCATFWCISV
jgi:hypothetical protein